MGGPTYQISRREPHKLHWFKLTHIHIFINTSLDKFNYEKISLDTLILVFLLFYTSHNAR